MTQRFEAYLTRWMVLPFPEVDRWQIWCRHSEGSDGPVESEKPWDYRSIGKQIFRYESLETVTVQQYKCVSIQAAFTKCHKLEAYKQKKIYSSQFRRLRGCRWERQRGEFWWGASSGSKTADFLLHLRMVEWAKQLSGTPLEGTNPIYKNSTLKN
jgi:hypothetical protein